MKSAIHFMLCCLLLSSVHSVAQLRPARSATPLPYFDDFEEGYVILRDGTRIEGNISLRNLEKDDRIAITDKAGNKYSLDPQSLSSWALNAPFPVSSSSLAYYDWNNQKRRENKEAERGFVVLTNGETKDGKIKIEGRSSDSYLAGSNFFALETLTFVDKAGNKTIYKRDHVKEYGRILPWALTPSEAYSFQAAVVMGVKRTKFQPGYIITIDGKRIEGEMSLIVKNTMNVEPEKRKTVSDVVDEIKFRRDGKDEKLDMDDVFAYGLINTTINTLTNNMDRSYSVEEMNFHPGSVTTSDGKKHEGLVAYFPTPGNYYGVYFATKPDEPVSIFAMKDITDVKQDISIIEAFDDGSVPVKQSNTNINGYVAGADGSKYEGTVSLVNDRGFWCGGIEFTDKDNKKQKFGGNDATIAYCMMNDVIYVQHGTVLMKAEKNTYPLVLYNNPYPDNTTALQKMMQEQTKETINPGGSFLGTVFANIAMKNDVKSGSSSSSAISAYNMGKELSDGISIKSKKKNEKLKEPYKCTKKSGDRFILNLATGEVAKADDFHLEILLEGCTGYLLMDKKEQKQLLTSDDDKIIEYLNTAYSNKK